MLTNIKARRFALILTVAALAAAAPGCAVATDEAVGQAEQAVSVWPDHVAQAQQYVDDVVGNEINNIYGSPASITYDASAKLHFKAECASFTTLLLENTYPGVITGNVLQTLTGISSPTAQDYYEGINPAVTHVSAGGISLSPLDAALASPTGRTLRSGTTTYLQVGDLLASRYAQGSITGHVMTVGQILYTPNPLLPNGDKMQLADTKAIPGVTDVRRWTVRIYDSTSSVHGSTDSRYGKDPTEYDAVDNKTSNDSGVGSGTIYLYEDATSGSATYGQLVGWTWSTGSSYTYQFTNATAVDNNGKTTYRRMMIGRFSGTGL